MGEYTIPRYRETPDRTSVETKVGWMVNNWNQFVSRLGPTFRDLMSVGLLGTDESEDFMKSIRSMGKKITSIEDRIDRNSPISEVSHPERVSLTRVRRDLTNTFPTHVHQVHQMYQVIDHLYGMGEISPDERDRLLDRVNRYDRLVRGMIGTLDNLRYETS